jgi:hypothetical protein
MSRVFLEFNGEDIASAEYDLFITNSSKDMEIRSVLKQLSQSAVQNGARLSLVTDVLRSDSITEMSRIIERYEIEAQEREEQQAKMDRESAMEQSQALIQDKQADRDIKTYEIDQKTAVEYAKIEADMMNKEADSNIEVEQDKISVEKSKIDASADSDRRKAELESKKIEAGKSIQATKDKTAKDIARMKNSEKKNK